MLYITESKAVIHIKQAQTSDAEELYQEYLKYQNGDNSALNRVFFEEKDRLRELTNKYYSSLKRTEYMDNVLDSEFICKFRTNGVAIPLPTA